ncbi:zinc ribbon domain-containing protein [Lactobacillus psittaci]|uniref:Uncharacterized protein n=1 Tax=Lactobacillus psittaci DSM 15354 TaxID=1122152 RepID=A0A0R1S3J2_9LACO|nr:zinc-ribbon domain-containing protein [Lactobacillus psittaci]KRL63615.1 hypothetical protein FC23_GL000524 [Lactobacillus psittaci DSM 15354]
MNKKFCFNCGTEVKADAVFCPNCGTNLSKHNQKPQSPKNNVVNTTPKSEPQHVQIPKVQPQKKQTVTREAVRATHQAKPLDKKTKAIYAGTAVVAVAVLGGFFFGKSYYSKENQISRISELIRNPQKGGLSQYVIASNSNVKPTDAKLKPLQTYFHNNTNEANKFISSLNGNIASSNTGISLVEDGKYFFLFPKYKLSCPTYDAKLYSNHKGTNVYVNGKNYGTLSGSDGDYSKKLSNLFVGQYNLNAKATISGRHLSASSQVNLFSPKNVDLSIKTLTFTVSSVPNATVYINDKKVGTLDNNGKKTFKEYPLTKNTELYVKFKSNGKTIASKVTTALGDYAADGEVGGALSHDDGKYVLTPSWKGVISKSDAEDLLGKAFDKDELSSDLFISGSDNSSYNELTKMFDQYDDNDKNISYSTSVKIISLTPAGNDDTNVVYEVKYSFTRDDGDLNQVMHYSGAVIHKNGEGDYQIKSIGGGKLISSNNDNDD